MRAVVVGAGLGGVAAAAALRQAGAEVVVVERDELPTAPSPRRGVPQAGQLHNLLSRAQWSLEELLPGLCEALLAAGGSAASVGDETEVYELGTHMPKRPLGLRLLCAPRPLIEHVARHELLREGGIELRERTTVEGLVVDADGITGVATGDGTLGADLVVDATGSAARGMDWLAAARAPRPEVEVLGVGQWYVTTVFRRPTEAIGDPRFWLVFPAPPGSRSGLVSPVGPDRWYVSVAGRPQDPMPTTVEEVRAHAASLDVPWIADLLRGAEAETEPHVFRKMTATWRHHERLSDPLPGYLPIGDAMASLNPLFGQGMSVASWQAVELAAVLGTTGDRAELTTSYLAAAGRACGAAWELGHLVDQPEGPSVAELHALAEQIIDDEAVHRRYVGIWHLIDPAGALAPTPSRSEERP